MSGIVADFARPKDNIQDVLKERSYYRDMLFCRGYVITTNDLEEFYQDHPFYGNWERVRLKHLPNGRVLNMYVHKWQRFYVYESKELSLVLIGHAYNPFTSQHLELEILEDLASAYSKSRDKFLDKVGELTGVHVIIVINEEEAFILQDCCGLMPIYYGHISGDLYLSSHSQLIADLCDLVMSLQVEQYLSASFYKIGISQLCGIESPFAELTMLSPNTLLAIPQCEVHRFYPRTALHKADMDTMSFIRNALRSSIEMCVLKWDCSISLTGGTDSQMTLASAKDFYDRLKFFSFVSSMAEEQDALAAGRICSGLGLEHVIYWIPENDSEITDFDVIASVMDHNQAYMRNRTGSDARKRAYLAQHTDVVVEIKSHVSEVARAFYYKKLGKLTFKYPLTPRNMSNLAKRNLFNRRILKYMDDSYRRFIEVTDFGDFPQGFDESDMFYWENRMPAWGALVKQSFDVSHETTIIYNNRKLLEAFLSFDLEARISDLPQQEIIAQLNPALSKLNISNLNAMTNKKRIILERIFFEVNSLLP